MDLPWWDDLVVGPPADHRPRLCHRVRRPGLGIEALNDEVIAAHINPDDRAGAPTEAWDDEYVTTDCELGGDRCVWIGLPDLEEGTLKLARQIGQQTSSPRWAPTKGAALRGISSRSWSNSARSRMPACTGRSSEHADQRPRRWARGPRRGHRELAAFVAPRAPGIPIICYNWMAAFGWLRTCSPRACGDAPPATITS